MGGGDKGGEMVLKSTDQSKMEETDTWRGEKNKEAKV